MSDVGKNQPRPPTPDGQPAKTGEGAQTALLALIRKRKLSGEPDPAGDASEVPPALGDH